MAVVLLAIGLLAGCRSDNGNNANANANSAARQAGGESNAQAKPAQSPTAQTTQAQATPVQITQTPAPVAGEADAVPVMDAAAFRDRLLELARSVQFDPRNDAPSNGSAIRGAWQKQYPQLKFTFFYSIAADPNTVSASDSFLMTGAAVSGNYDQLYSFAVVDTKGKCAGGAAVIPGDSANHKVSEAKAPTVFKAIDMTTAKSCTGREAGDNYKP